ncbi:MAG: single-stranded DNA-binding protein [Helicobacter sp.]|nr:single-stranded DNA-binding protein [Helicobacter sp.]
MYNRIILVGNLTRDVELRYLPSGSAVARIGLATNRRFKKQDGTMDDEVCFVDVSLFGRTAEVANQYLKKGSKVLIEGRLVLESWVDQSGQKRSKHSVRADSMQMMDSKGSSPAAYDDDYHAPQNQGYDSGANGANMAKQPQKENIPDIDVDDDDIPF